MPRLLPVARGLWFLAILQILQSVFSLESQTTEIDLHPLEPIIFDLYEEDLHMPVVSSETWAICDFRLIVVHSKWTAIWFRYRS